MKKLMIAVAVAAMIGGAQAEDYIYKTTFRLNTTKGKNVKTTVKHQIQLGMNADKTAIWYEDAAASNFIWNSSAYPVDTYWTVGKVGGTPVPTLTTAAKKDLDFLADFEEVCTSNALTTVYGYKSANKWCLDVSWKETIEGCYRAKTTRTFTGYVVDMCAQANGLGQYLDPSMKTAEFYGTFADGDLVTVVKDDDGVYSEDDPIDMEGFDGSFAGFGSLTSISGYVVGMKDAPSCEYCCALPDAAGAVELCDLDASKTIAYGTFSAKYDKKVSQNWN